MNPLLLPKGLGSRVSSIPGPTHPHGRRGARGSKSRGSSVPVRIPMSGEHDAGTSMVPYVALAILCANLGVWSCSGGHHRIHDPVRAAHEPGGPQPRGHPTYERVLAGIEPWWAGVKPGPYRVLGGTPQPGRWLLAEGRSTSHHHAAEGLLKARIDARLRLRAQVDGSRAIEPVLIDLFITPERHFFVLYGIPLDEDKDPMPVLSPPSALAIRGQHNVGRHRFYDERHLYLECDIEGPLTNPDWGSRQMTAHLVLEKP